MSPSLTRRVVSCLAALLLAACPALADWPSFTGPGSFRAHPMTRALVDRPDAVRLLWNGPEHLGVCKGTSGGPIGDANKGAAAMGLSVNDLFYGGASSPIVAEGMVFVAYWQPSGPDDTKHPQGWAKDPDYPKAFKKIAADDALIAIDAVTGRTRWKAVEKDSGVNIGGGKRSHWCVSPVYADGRVFMLNPLGRVFAYEAETGKKLWESPADPDLLRLKEVALAGRHFAMHGSPKTWGLRRQNSLAYAGGALIIPKRGAMRALDPKTGQQLWVSTYHSKEKTGANLHHRTTPAVWRHEGREYLVINGMTELQLVDPKTGKVLWRHKTFPWIETPVVAGDLVICPLRPSKKFAFTHKDQPKYAVHGALRLSLEGPAVAWQFPEEAATVRRLLVSDSGSRRRVALGDGVAVVTFSKIREKKIDPVEGKAFGTPADATMLRPARSFLVRLKDGKILATLGEGYHEGETIGYFLSRTHYLAHSDMQHSQGSGNDYRYYHVDPDAGTAKYLGSIKTRHWQRTAYEVPIEIPVVDGRVYYRSLKGIACYDFGVAAN